METEREQYASNSRLFLPPIQTFPRKWTTFFGLAVISKKDKRRAGRKISASRDFVAWVSRENDKLEDNDARGIINQAAD